MAPGLSLVQAQWNNMEAGLLIAALCIAALTTLLLANEIHWARSESWIRRWTHS